MKSIVFAGGKMAGGIASNLHSLGKRDVVVAIRDADTAQEANAAGRLVVHGKKGSRLSLELDLNAPVSSATNTNDAIEEAPATMSKAKISVQPYQAIPPLVVSPNGVEGMFCCLPLLNLKQSLTQQVVPLLTSLAQAEEAGVTGGTKLTANENSRLPPLILCTRGLTGFGKTAIDVAKEVIAEAGLDAEARGREGFPLFVMGGPFSALGLLKSPPLLIRRLWFEAETPTSSSRFSDVSKVSCLLDNTLASNVLHGVFSDSAAALQLVSAMGLVAAWLSGMLKAHFDSDDQSDVQALLHSLCLEMFSEILVAAYYSHEATKTEQVSKANAALSTQLMHALMEVDSVEHQFGQKQYVLEEFKDHHFWAGPGFSMEDMMNTDVEEANSFVELGSRFPDVHHQCVLTTMVGLRSLATKHKCSEDVQQFLEQLISVASFRRRGHEMAEHILDRSSWSWLERPPPITPTLQTMNALADVQERGGDPVEFDEVVHRMMRSRLQPVKTMMGLDPDA